MLKPCTLCRETLPLSEFYAAPGCTGNCEGRIEAMHLDFAGGKGVATKVADRHAIPGCSGHHGRQHTKGWATFTKEVGVSKEALMEAANRFWKAWPGRSKWEAKQ